MRKAAFEFLDQRLRLGILLHRGKPAHPLQRLLQVVGMFLAQRLAVGGAALGEQAALGDEGLVQIAVGVEHQADARQVAGSQLRAGVHHQTDAAHAEHAHHQQQDRHAENRQGQFPAKTKVDKYTEHRITP